MIEGSAPAPLAGHQHLLDQRPEGPARPGHTICAAKAGDIGFTKALALENAKGGITVNAICPGYINTEMVQAVPKEVLEKSILPLIPVNRLGEPEEIARAVVFLAADEAGAITGSTLTINGGQYMV